MAHEAAAGNAETGSIKSERKYLYENVFDQ